MKFKSIKIITASALTSALLSGCMTTSTVFLVDENGMVKLEEFAVSSYALGWVEITDYNTEMAVNILDDSGVETGITEIKLPSSFDNFQKKTSDEFFESINPKLNNPFSKLECEFNEFEELYYMLCAREVEPYSIAQNVVAGEWVEEYVTMDVDGSPISFKAMTLEGNLTGFKKTYKDVFLDYENRTYEDKDSFIKGAQGMHEHEGEDSHSHDINPEAIAFSKIIFEKGIVFFAEGDTVQNFGENFIDFEFKNGSNDYVKMTIILDYEEQLLNEPDVLEPSSNTANDLNRDNMVSLYLIIVSLILATVFIIVIQRKNRV